MALSWSIENQIIEKMAKLDCTAAFVSAVAGISQCRLSQGLSGLRPLSNQDAITILRHIERLEQLAKMTEPVPISWRNPAVIRNILDCIEDGHLQISISKLEPEVQVGQ